MSLNEAISLLKSEEVVALPTETVYGLAARVDSERGLKSIFSTKKRPFFDPLIVHVQSLEQAQDYGVFDEFSLALAKKFWPGPLSLVLPRTEKVSDIITHGGPTVALRCPDHSLFQKVLSSLSSPLAAPSANMFGKTSPTEAAHVLDEFHSKVPVLDGGPCEKGIESTVIRFNPDETTLEILRPGVLTEEDFLAVLKTQKGPIPITTKKLEHTPGGLKNHYQPSVPLYLANEPLDESARDFLENSLPLPPQLWELNPNPSLAARELYRDLRVFSQKGSPICLVIQKHWLKDSLWKGILDRLQKASHGSLQKEGTQWTLKKKS